MALMELVTLYRIVTHARLPDTATEIAAGGFIGGLHRNSGVVTDSWLQS